MDGGIGPNSLKAVNEHVSRWSIEQTIDNYQAERQKYYERLKTFETFGRGWTRRVQETTKEAMNMI